MGFYGLAYVIKYLDGNIFLNFYTSSAGECFGKLSVILLLRWISPRQTLLLGLSVSSVGLLLLILCNDRPDLMPLVLAIARIGVCIGFVALYLCAVMCYPTILANTVMGVCVTIGKGGTIFAPMIVELEAPWNLVFVLVIVALSAIVSTCLNTDI